MKFQKLCNRVMKFFGWRFEVQIPPDLTSYVLIGAPHTTNYDFFAAMGIAPELNSRARFVIKHEWTKFPFGLLMNPLGAYGLNRDKIKNHHNMNSTELMASMFESEKDFVLMIAPEGTRKANPEWKTGFYYIALKANVPIVLGYVDYSKKVVGLGPVIYPTDFESDMKKIMDFYTGVTPKIPKNFKRDHRYL